MDTKADQEPELFPCPFCGGRARFSETPRAYDFQQAIECESCGANTGPAGVGGEEVVLRWNRRVAALVAKSARTPAVPNTNNLDDAVLAMLSLCIINDEIGDRPGIQAEEGFDYESLVRLHKKGYLATCPHPPINAIWLTPEGARRARELFRQMFCE